MPNNERKSVYDIVSESILKALEDGTVPWKKPWKTAGLGQRNLRGTGYRGINQFLLQMVALRNNYENPVWMTFKQAQAEGGTVKKGEKGVPVVFWKPMKKTEKQSDGSNKDKSFMLLRYFTVFNVAQTEGITLVSPSTDKVVEPLEQCESIVKGMPNAPSIIHGSAMACYSPSADTITLPPMSAFDNREAYYATLFHELGHSTGHETRLDRESLTNEERYSKHQYGEEELVAEFTAAFLCGMAGISPAVIASSAAYIDHWRKAVSLDSKLVVNAASKAQKAADHILGKKEESKSKDDEDDEG